MMAIAEMEAVLKEKGYKMTEQRRIILSVLEENQVPMTAQEVFELVKKTHNNINFSTIYRNLEFLSELNIVDKLNLKSGVCHFEINRNSHHHHVICKGCGDMKTIDICPFKNIANEEFKKMNFEPVEHRFEIYGYCSKCSKSKK
ncbi:MAG: Fur family transcriptional regulator [Bacillota bacterium]